MYRKVIGAALVTTLALGLGACGAGQEAKSGKDAGKAQAKATPKPVTPLDLVKAAAGRFATQNTNKIEVSMSMDMPIKGQQATLALRGTGVSQYKPPARDVTFTGTVKVAGQTIPMNLHEITVNNTSYTKTNDEKWKKAPADSAGSTSPSMDSLGILLGADNVTKGGTEKIHGQNATEYNAVINLDKAVASSDESAKQEMTDLKNQLGVSTMPLKVWLDDKGRVARFKVKMPIKIEGQAAKADITMSMWDYGVPVRVAAPTV